MAHAESPVPRSAKSLASMVMQRAAAVEQAVSDVDDEHLWRRLSPGTNAMGNLVLHLAGNLMNYIVSGVGGQAYERDRPREFEATMVPRSDLLAGFHAAVTATVDVIETTGQNVLDRPYCGPEYAGEDNRTVMLRSVEHLGYHTGQLVLMASVLRS